MKKISCLNKTKKYSLVGGASLIMAAALLLLARKVPVFAQWYSENVYEVLVTAVGGLFGIFPFSLSEVLLYVLIISASLLLARLVIRLVRGKAGKAEIARLGAGVFCMAGVLIFIYAASCGVNYHKTSFAASIGLKADNYTAAQLAEVCLVLTESVNSDAETVARNQDGVMVVTCNVAENARAEMINLSEDFSCLEGYYPKPKGLIFPWILSVQKITGIYSPFTIEANYNTGMTDYNIPFTACHELSHLRGFMREDEANFIGYLACLGAEDADYRYSGYLLGWIYAGNALAKVDYEQYVENYSMLSDPVIADLEANHDFWEQYEGQVANVQETVNDAYLKANGQAEGVRTYGRVVDLMILDFQYRK